MNIKFVYRAADFLNKTNPGKLAYIDNMDRPTKRGLKTYTPIFTKSQTGV